MGSLQQPRQQRAVQHFDRAGSPIALSVNQQLTPNTPINSINWQNLGVFNTSTGALSVSLTNLANGYVVADAVMIVNQSAGVRQQQLVLQ